MQAEDLIRRPDGSYIDIREVEPRQALAHELVTSLFPQAESVHDRLVELKKLALDEMYGYREMMLDDYGVSVGGKEGNLTLRSLCGRQMVRLSVCKQVNFGPELEAAKALIDEFMEQEMAKGGSEALHDIVRKVFKVNKEKRVDSSGILGLREHPIKDPIWLRAMDAIEDAICRDISAIYVNFYRVDIEQKPKSEKLLPLDLAKV